MPHSRELEPAVTDSNPPTVPDNGSQNSVRSFLEIFFLQHHHRMVQFVARHIPNPATAEDIMQQAYLRMLATNGRPINNRAAYLNRIVRNIMADSFRSNRPDPDIEPHSLNFFSPFGLPEPCVIQQEALTELCQLAHQVLTPDRLAVCQAYLELVGERNPVQQLAEQTGMPYNTVKGHLRRARRSLNAALRQSRHGSNHS